jgi:crotonobetainyl-CoA:carnitine CoA-transferase CaiB-like acyl-CoA transferase
MSLSPFRVLDLAEGGFNWCGKVLGDLGADVIKVEPLGGSPTRGRAPTYTASNGAETSLFWEAYCANKRGITLDIESSEGSQALKSLVADADIVVESFAPGYMSSLGLGYEHLSEINPGLVMASITPFGQTGPYSQYRATDLVAWAMGGMQYVGGDPDRPPVRISFPQAELNAAGQAAAGAMTALWHRQMTGRGQHVDVSMQVAVIWTLMNATPYPPLHRDNVEREGAFRSRGRLRVRQVFRCADGYLSVLMNPRTIIPIVQWMDEESVVPDWLAAMDFDGYDLAKAVAEDDTETIETFIKIQSLVEGFFDGKTKAEVYDRAIWHRILAAPCNTVQDIAESPQLEARDFWPRLDHPELDEKLTHLGPFIKMSESPIQLRRPAPGIGEHNDEILGSLTEFAPADSAPSTTDAGDASAQMPFKGLKVLDFTWVGVGPITMKYFSDHGADVIRVESVSRPDVLRNGPPFKDATPGINRSQFPANYNTGKRGLGLNMATPEAREIVKRLIETWQPDIVAESFTPRVMSSWGLGYEDVRAIKPDVIYFSTCQQGQTGPHSVYAGFGQLAGALAGYYHLTGWPDRDPAGPYGAYSDFVNPPNAYAAIVAALEYRRRTGKGQHLDLSQYECATHYLAPALMDYMLTGRILGREGNGDDALAPHGVYRCKDADREYTGLGESWLAIAVDGQDEWTALCDAMGKSDMAAEPRFRTASERRQNSEALDEAIQGWASIQDSHEAMGLLQRAGISAGAVQNQADLWQDPQLQHRGFFTWLDHTECGPMPYDGLQFLLSDTPGRLTPQALIGEHNESLLKEKLGLADDEIADLVASGALESS